MTTAAEWLAKHGHKRMGDVDVLPPPAPANNPPAAGSGGEGGASLEDKVRDAVADGQAQRRKDTKDIAASARQAVIDEILTSEQVAIDQYGEARLLTYQGPRRVAIRLESREMQDFIQARAVERTGKPLGREAATAIIAVRRANALKAGARVQVYVRVASELREHERLYYLNLANEAGEVVEIDAQGWRVIHNDRIAFLSGGGPLPIPTKPESLAEAYALLAEFLEKHGVRRKMVLVVVAVLCEWLRPDTAHPIINSFGPAGSGKTTLARVITSIIDPTGSGKLAEAKLEEEHVAAQAQSSHILVVDNITRLTRDAQDLCCRICYGYEAVARRYYTQDESIRQPIHNAIIMTSINPAITAPDLQDRAIRIQFRSRGRFTSQIELAAGLEADRPKVLGALLTIFSAALAHLDTTRAWPHRLVDFAQLGEAIATALGEPPGHFSNLLTETARSTAQDYADGDTLILLLQKVLEAKALGAQAASTMPSAKSWADGWYAIRPPSGKVLVGFTPQTLLDALRGEAGFEDRSALPSTPRALGLTINSKTPILSALGIRAEQRAAGRARRTVWVFAVG